jgi:hypothetical protein
MDLPSQKHPLRSPHNVSLSKSSPMNSPLVKYSYDKFQLESNLIIIHFYVNYQNRSFVAPDRLLHDPEVL